MKKQLKNAKGDNAFPATIFESVIDRFGLQLDEVIGRTYVKGINHRGYIDAPENTIPAYILSWKNGFRYVECDVAFTSDNVAVLLHDSTIDRTSDGTGSIASLTYEQVYQYDFGSWKSSIYAGTKIPTLFEFLVLCRNLGIHPYIEIKSDTNYTEVQLKSIIDMVYSLGMKGKVSYISFNASFLQTIKSLDPTARLGYVVFSITSSVVSSAIALKTESNEVFIDSKDYSSSSIELCKSNNIPLEVWVVNTDDEIKSLDDYISGVTSDSCNMENIRGTYAYFD